LQICIAKNDGPQNFDGEDDIAFAEKLALWYNTATPTMPPAGDDVMWKSLQKFWSRRNHYYVREIIDIRNNWIKADSKRKKNKKNLKRTTHSIEKRSFHFSLLPTSLTKTLHRSKACL
jgi:hypothetical protein